MYRSIRLERVEGLVHSEAQLRMISNPGGPSTKINDRRATRANTDAGTKHASHIVVKRGVTLYAIDEDTGSRAVAEYYCRTSEDAISGKVAITKAPALQSGDVQVSCKRSRRSQWMNFPLMICTYGLCFSQSPRAVSTSHSIVRLWILTEKPKV